MAKAYLGKISALVTANTSDFNSKLNASAKEVRSFASAMQSSLTRAESAATASLRGIYTESQKVSRALQAVSSKRLDFKGFDTSTFAKLQQAVDTFKQIQNAATNIFDPLANAARVVERLSASVQREFDPAMKSAQRSAEFLNQQLERGGVAGERAFERVRQKVVAAAEAADRLAEAEALAGRGPRGTELAFAAPRVRDTLTASAATRQRAAEAPAALLDDGRIARDVQKLASIDALIVKRRAQIEQGIALNVDTSQAQRSLESLAALSERVRGRIDGALNAEAIEANQGAFSRRATDIRAYLQQLEEARVRTEALADAQRRAAAASQLLVVDQRESNLISRSGESTDVRQRLSAINAARQAAEEEATYRARAADEAEREAAAIGRVVEAQNRLVVAESERRSGATARRNAASFDDATQGILSTPRREAEVLIGRRQQTVDSLIADISRLDQQFQALPRSVQDALQGEAARLNDIADAARNGSAGIGTLAAQYERLRTLVSNAADEQDRLAAANDRLTILNNPPPPSSPFDPSESLRRRAAAFVGGDIPDIGSAEGRVLDTGRQLDVIGRSIRATREQIDSLPEGIRAGLVPSLQETIGLFIDVSSRAGATADEIERARANANELANSTRALQAGFNFASQFGGAGTSGVEFGLQEVSLRSYTAQLQVLQRALAGASSEAREVGVSAFNQLRTAVAAAAARGTLDTREFREEVEQLTQQAIRAASAVSGISVGNLSRSVARAGDVGRAGFDRFSLAVQQAGFAIDDFFSVTGGFDQRIRAVSNNISQLGFILGGTAGLFLSLGVTITTQVAILVGKYVMGLEDTKTAQERVKRETETLNTAFSNQQEIVEKLAGAYAKLGKEIRSATLPEQNRRAVERQETADEVRSQQQQSRRELIAQQSPEVFRLREERQQLEQQLRDNAPDFAAQADIRGRISANVQQENDIVSRIEDAAANRRSRQDPLLNQNGLRIFQDAVLNDVRERNRLVAAGADTAPRDALLADNARVASELAVGLQQAKDAAILAAFEFSGPLSDAISSAQKRIESLGDFVDKDTRDAITRAGFELADVASKAASGALSRGGVVQEIDRIRQQTANAVESIDFSESFKASFEASQKAIQEARSAADSSAERGRTLGMSPGEQGGRELAQGLQDIRRSFGAIAEETTGLVDEAAILSRQRSFVEQQRRSTAPAIFNMADEVQNAVLQGPSRAALQASDITTSQGASELNRLLRGDDSARNQNLVELQKQSQNLQRLVQIAEQNGAPPGVFDN